MHVALLGPVCEVVTPIPFVLAFSIGADVVHLAGSLCGEEVVLAFADGCVLRVTLSIPVVDGRTHENPESIGCSSESTKLRRID